MNPTSGNFILQWVRLLPLARLLKYGSQIRSDCEVRKVVFAKLRFDKRKLLSVKPFGVGPAPGG